MTRRRMPLSLAGLLATMLPLAGCRTAGPRTPPVSLDAPYLRAVDGDLQEAAFRFARGALNGREYLALSIDRAGKARRYHDDASWRRGAASGDQDGDRVPDRFDRCPTPSLTPTDEHGCPLPTVPECPPGLPGCRERTEEDDRRTRDLLEKAVLLINPACDGTARPAASIPLVWGHGTGDLRNTFYFVISKSGTTAQGCELFYEMEFRVELLHLGAEQLVRYLTVLFRSTEDLTPNDPDRAVFSVSFPNPPSEARGELWGALMNAREVRWRVRAVSGDQSTSPWSAMPRKDEAPGGLSF